MRLGAPEDHMSQSMLPLPEQASLLALSLGLSGI